jgi:hypothetical protein
MGHFPDEPSAAAVRNHRTMTPARGSRPRLEDLLELSNRPRPSHIPARFPEEERPSPRVWERLLRSVRELDEVN